MLSNKHLPNVISSTRIAFTAWLLFMEPLSPLFMVVYALTGVSDVLDGAIARRYGTTSELGATLDSIADLLLYTLVLIRIFPVMWVTLPRKIWVMVGAILVVRFAAYGTFAVKHHRLAALHTYLNKATGLLVFGVAFFIKTRIAVPYCWIVCIVGMLSSAEELLIHLTSDEYDPNRKMLFKKN